MCVEATIDYFPRARLWPLARQYFKYGAGRAGTLLKHQVPPRPRQMAAPAILIGCIGGLALEPFLPWFAAAPIGYALGCVGWGSLAAAAGARSMASRDRARGDDGAFQLGRRIPLDCSRRGTGPIAALFPAPRQGGMMPPSGGRDDSVAGPVIEIVPPFRCTLPAKTVRQSGARPVALRACGQGLR